MGGLHSDYMPNKDGQQQKDFTKKMFYTTAIDDRLRTVSNKYTPQKCFDLTERLQADLNQSETNRQYKDVW